MSRQLKISRLARSAGFDPDDVVLLLLEDGMDVDSAETVLSTKQQRRARSVLRAARTGARSGDGAARILERAPVEWPVLDPEPVRFLNADDVMAAHEALINAFAGTEDAVDPPGARDINFLEAALFRPQTEAFGIRKYPTVQLAAAALLHSLILDHPFFNGNKRTALIAAVWFLRHNDHMCLFTEAELYALIVAIAEHQVAEVKTDVRPSADEEVLAIHRWLRSRSRPPTHGDKRMIWHRLERILRGFDCTFDRPRHNKRNIYRGSLRTQVGFSRPGMDVDPPTIKKIRADLQLVDQYGIDSKVFYSVASPVKGPADIVRGYRRVLTELSRYDRGEVLGTAG